MSTRTSKALARAATPTALAQREVHAESFDLLVVFELADQQYGLFASNVREIIRNRRTTRVPNAEDCILGVINLRGSIIPVFDTRRRLKLPEVTAEQATQLAVMVVESSGHDAGLLVDRVVDVVRIGDAEINRTAQVVEHGKTQRFIEGTVEASGRLVTLLKLEALLEG